jgi:FkbM family methyltransferase
MTALHRLRMFARRTFKVDCLRYPESDPLFEVVQLLRTAGVSLVLDVGANDGGYARTIRQLGYRGRIVSFEPTREAYRRLIRSARGDTRWETLHLALSDFEGSTDIHVAGNAAASSSILPMLDRHREVRPSSAYTHDERVQVQRLDQVLPALHRDHDVIFVKLDVQGAERSVLDGASASLPTIVGVQIELNLVPLYDGQAPYRTLMDRLLEQGFELVGLVPGFTDGRTGQLLAADGVFMRTAALSV